MSCACCSAPCWRSIGTALLQIAAVTSVILLVIAALYRPLAVGAFDPAFLRAVGARAPYGAMFVALVVLALVASFQAFGTLLAVGPMLLPAAAARCWGLGVAASMALAIAFGLMASIAGLLVSYHGNLPSGPAIVLAGGLLFGVSLVATSCLRRLAPDVRKRRLMFRCVIACWPSCCWLASGVCRGPSRRGRDVQRHRRHARQCRRRPCRDHDHRRRRRRQRAVPADCSRRRDRRIGARRVPQRPQRRVRALAGAAAQAGRVQGREGGGHRAACGR